jgi:predicted Zn-dependent peptidase
VQIDRTVDSLKEMRTEIDGYADGSKPATPDEVAKIKATEIRGLPGAYETARSVLSTIGGIVRYDRPDDYVFQRKAEVESLTAAQVQAAAGTIDPRALTWVVVGDLEKIEQPVRALGLGEVSIVDADGKPVADAPVAKGDQ